MKRKRLAVLTSGGDAPGMNACVRAVVRTAHYYDADVIGILRGYAGLLEGQNQRLTLGSVGDIIQRGGTFLRTARSKEFMEPAGLLKAVQVLQKMEVEGLIVVGGDGSFRGALTLAAQGIPVVGIPATIDNDIPGTEYSLGFDTALNTALDALNKIRDTVTSHDRNSIIEVMGRHAGQIALFVGLAGGAESILVPEVPYNIDDVCERILRGHSRGKLHSIIVVAEGAGSALEIGKLVESKTGLETRVTILGHLQRGGNPTAIDRIWASRMGAKSVELILGESKEGYEMNAKTFMVGVQKGEIVVLDLCHALTVKREFDRELYQLAGILSV